MPLQNRQETIAGRTREHCTGQYDGMIPLAFGQRLPYGLERISGVLKRECPTLVAGCRHDDETEISIEYGLFMAQGGPNTILVFGDEFIQTILLSWSTT